MPDIVFGSMPNDGGMLLFSDAEKSEFLAIEPNSAPLFRKFTGADEFINNTKRWCIWLLNVNPTELRQLPAVIKRIEAVKKYRQASTREATRKLAITPTLFGENRQPTVPYLLIPKVSSGQRLFIPIGFMPANIIASDLCLIIPNATLFHFGILTSTMHNSWVRAVCGRLGNGYRYSAKIVYNNYPWPEPTDKRQQAIETAAQGVLDARAVHPEATLADLYDPLTMPTNLLKAHQKLDKAVDAAYGYTVAPTDAARVAFLFTLYQKLTSLLPVATKPTKRRRK